MGGTLLQFAEAGTKLKRNIRHADLSSHTTLTEERLANETNSNHRAISPRTSKNKR